MLTNTIMFWSRDQDLKGKRVAQILGHAACLFLVGFETDRRTPKQGVRRCLCTSTDSVVMGIIKSYWQPLLMDKRPIQFCTTSLRIGRAGASRNICRECTPPAKVSRSCVGPSVATKSLDRVNKPL